MNSNEAPSNVIQFPNKKKDAEDKVTPPQIPVTTPASKSKHSQVKTGVKVSSTGAIKTVMTALAIALASVAANKFAFSSPRVAALDQASISTSLRTLASVNSGTFKRDAAWEMELSERLAAPQIRSLASNGIGHSATAEEKLRWGTLEEKYTIVYKSDVHNIETVELQDPQTDPAYVLDRRKFLNEYGSLLQESFGSAQLKSVEVSHDKTVEFYTLFDKDKRPKSEARFELDIHKRLLSLKVEARQN